ncbi:hypothetical protein ACOMHN_054555 [Nucella lapillus]
MASGWSNYEFVDKAECDVSDKEGGRDVTTPMETDTLTVSLANSPPGGLYPPLPSESVYSNTQPQSGPPTPRPPPPANPPPQYSPKKTATKTPPPEAHPTKKTKPTSRNTKPQDQSAPQMFDPLRASGESPEAGVTVQVTHGAGPGREEGREFRVLVIGKTGNGKSSLCNAILGERPFAVGRGMLTTTTQAQAVTAQVFGKRLKVIDTPDLTNLNADPATAQRHIREWQRLSNPSPDLVLLAVRCDVPYTREERAIFQQITDLWRDESVLATKMAVAFTFGDLQDVDLAEELKDVCEELQNVLKDCQNRYLQVNCRATSSEERERLQRKVCQLLDEPSMHGFQHDQHPRDQARKGDSWHVPQYMTGMASGWPSYDKAAFDVSGKEGRRDVTTPMETDTLTVSSANSPGGLYPPLPSESGPPTRPPPPANPPPQYSPKKTATKTPPPEAHPTKKTKPTILPSTNTRPQDQSALQMFDPLGVSGEPSEVGATDQVTYGPGPGREEGGEFRVLVIGKTGNGKSSLCNAILGERPFAVGKGMLTTTTQAQAATAQVFGKRLKVIDTPDLTNLNADLATAQRHIHQWQQLSNPSPDLVLLAVRCDVRYTREEHAIFQQITDLWRDKSVFAIKMAVAFTFGDLQDEDLAEQLKDVCEELQKVLRDCRNRYLQVNCRANSGEERERLQWKVFQLMDDPSMHGFQHGQRPLDQARKGGPLHEPHQPLQHTMSLTPKKLALLVIGKSGHGKSSFANLISGKQSFYVRTGPATVTRDVALEDVCFHDTDLRIIDTPDLRGQPPTFAQQEISKWKSLTIGYRAIFLLVVRCDVRYTSEEVAVYKAIKHYWSKGPVVPPRVVVVFTFTDRLDYNLMQHVRDTPELKWVALDEAGESYLEVNSKAGARPDRSAVQTERQEALDILLALLQR